MGIFTVRAKLYAGFPQAGGKPSDVEWLLNTGATFTVIPREMLNRLGVSPVETREILTVDRKPLRRELGYAGIEVAGRKVLSPVLFGEGEDFAVLGAVTLEIAGLAVDPERKELFARPSLLL